jgi:hypothetical protein
VTVVRLCLLVTETLLEESLCLVVDSGVVGCCGGTTSGVVISC